MGYNSGRQFIKFAILGLGFMGCTHLRALRAIPGVEVGAVCSLDEKALSGDLTSVEGNVGGPGERLDFSGIGRYRDLEAALAAPGIDAVDVCLPTDLHSPVAIEALRAGKHVLVEKPMALDGYAADGMTQAARRHGRVLMVAHVVRFLPAYAALRDVVRGGEWGPVRSAVFRRRCGAPAWNEWMMDPSRSGGGVFDLLIHDVDFCLHLFGKPETMLATGYADLAAGIDCLHVQLFYPHGVVTVEGGWFNPRSYPFSAEYTVALDGGVVEYHSGDAAPLAYERDGARRELAPSGADGYAAEIQYFVECCRARRAPELCPPAESADAVKVMRLVLEARKRKGARMVCKT